MTIFDDTPCKLGECPLWHPERAALFWVDILERRVCMRAGDATQVWTFDEMVSAVAIVDDARLLVASETRLLTLDVATGRREDVHPLEAGDPVTRANDGRADPWGGFWIGTMGKNAEQAAGSIWRYYRGELRRLHQRLTIPNAICFSPDRRHAYLADTATQVIRRQRLGADGWPDAEAEPFIDLREGGWRPDGAVTDAAGNLWNAQYGAARVACYDPEGRFLRAVDLPATQTTCPAFGGAGLTTLFCTSAFQTLSEAAREAVPEHGMTFAVAGVGRGRPEPRVTL